MIAVVALLTLIPAVGRQTINLDAGWECVRLPSPPSVWTGPDAVPTSLWRVVRVSSQETTAESADATRAFDGNPNTFWHSEWKARQAPYPHGLIVDLGVDSEVVGLRLLPRQTSPQNGRPDHFQLFLSDNPNNWGAPAFDGTAPDSGALFEARFPGKEGRYARWVFLDGHRKSEPFLAISELGLIRNLDQSTQKGWQSQYNIANIQSGDKRFDLPLADLERLKRAEFAALGKTPWTSATLPQAVWIRPLNNPEIWQGVAYYRRHLSAPAGNRHVELLLDGAMQSADLWLNGKNVAERRGGYLPLWVDLTGKLRAQNELLVRVDNSDNPLIPPGKPQSQLDFMYGSGITRHATLFATNRLFITNPLGESERFGGGVYVSYPSVSGGRAMVRVRTHVRNSGGTSQTFRIRQMIRDARGRVVAQVSNPEILAASAARRWSQDLAVPKPRLWSPDSPNRYTLISEIEERGQVVDQVETRIGIRTIEVSRQGGFVINGKPLRLVGTNRHQDYPWVGPALSDAANRRDALLIKRSGHNIVRLSHYPQSPAFLDACDEFGVFTIPCIPGWQFVNRDPRFAARVKRDIQEMIRRDRNHPSVAMWEASLNETYPGAAMAKEWFDTAKAEEVEGGAPLAGDGTTGAPWEVVYNTWREDLSRPQDVFPDRPGYIREYGDYEFGGAVSSSRVRMGQGMDKLLQETWNHVWSYNKFRTQYPWTMGAGTWEMFDHNVPWSFAVSASGLADLFRREKPSFWFYESQSIAKPFLKVAATWQPGPHRRRIVAFTNCDRAELFLNGKLIQTAAAVRGRSMGYGEAQPFDGSNTENLAHPPIIFEAVPFTPGLLKVVGLQGGRPVTSDTIRTAGKPFRLKVWLDDLGVPPTENDLVFVRAAIVDRDGTICPEGSRKVIFSVSGAAIAGEGAVSSEMGVGSVLIRTPGRGSRAIVRATWSGLVGTCAVTVP